MGWVNPIIRLDGYKGTIVWQLTGNPLFLNLLPWRLVINERSCKKLNLYEICACEVLCWRVYGFSLLWSCKNRSFVTIQFSICTFTSREIKLRLTKDFNLKPYQLSLDKVCTNVEMYKRRNSEYFSCFRQHNPN